MAVGPCFRTARSTVNVVVLDSGWEGSEAFHLDHDPRVRAWVKNDHLGFEIYYTFEGVLRRYRPDYLAQRTDGVTLIIETKGQITPEVLAKKAAADEWVEAVNATGRFGEWRYALCEKPQRMLDALADKILANCFDQP